MHPQTKEILSYVQQLLGEALSKDMQRVLGEIGSIYHSGKRYLTSYDLANLFGMYGYYRDVHLFSENNRPTSAHEFLSCLKLAFIKLGIRFDRTFEKLMMSVPLLTKHQEEQRAWEIEVWKNTLSQASDEAPAITMIPRLRMRLQQTSCMLEVSYSQEPFRKIGVTKMRELDRSISRWHDLLSSTIFEGFRDRYDSFSNQLDFSNSALTSLLDKLIREPGAIANYLVDAHESPVILHASPLHWQASDQPSDPSRVQFGLYSEKGEAVHHYDLVIPGDTIHLLTQNGIYPVASWPNFIDKLHLPFSVPKAALHSTQGVAFYKKIAVPVPEEIAKKVTYRKSSVEVKCEVDKKLFSNSDSLVIQAMAFRSGKKPYWYWNADQWHLKENNIIINEGIVEYDDSVLARSAAWISQMNFKPMLYHREAKQSLRMQKNFPDTFLEWMDQKPDGVSVLLDQELSDMFNGVVSGNVTLDIEQSSSGIDWFDIHVNVSLTDTSLSKEEIDLLLKAKGKWVKLQDKGWRKLDYEFSEETLKELADIGLSISDFNGEKQKLHALQLGSLAKKKSPLLKDANVEEITRRIEDIQTRVTPQVPASISATLRPYQEEGFHFLAYLTTNQFGGVLADDMGLGKTLQALTWLAWLHANGKKSLPSLVVAPKSVQDNWSAEAARFYPNLRTRTWKPGDLDDTIDPSSFDLLIINYAQLRNRSEPLTDIAWLAVIVDEAQNIKNPSSQSTQCVRALNANQRLALTGTPIENRLMDLWSIFSFAMPGALGSRTSFTKNYDKADDPFARRRLSARTRPFLLRRTKNEVAKDLPDRIEEDIFVELEGTQSTLYQAELKRARAHLLNAAIPGKLDAMRFHILTSLLRLRQICCHPALVGLEKDEEITPPSEEKKSKSTKKVTTKKIDASHSAKLEAMLEIIEPLVEEGQKVLIFSQFVSMLEIIQIELEKRKWKHFILTGKTDERGALVNEFQSTEGAAIFLISLKAGGAGLNLTAASYVVLFDPWWNPAVEAQAIDRTHRIGQKSTVIAYRMVAKNSIEQKIRDLQKQKTAIANDILGEENFAKALTLSDFQFLLGDG